MSQFQIYDAEFLFNKYKALCESTESLRIKYLSIAGICQNNMKLSKEDLIRFAEDTELTVKMLENQISAIRSLKGQVVKHIGDCTKNPRSDL